MSDKEKDIHDSDEPKKPTIPYDGPTTADDPEGGQTQSGGGGDPQGGNAGGG